MSAPSKKLDLKKSFSSTSGVDDLIGIVNQLQDKLAASGVPFQISLPQIAVVGSQSAGKSSTLENIVGREFLPRGTGVVTRRPTVVQLIPNDEEYATFLHKPGIKFTYFPDVKNEIIEETKRNPGPVGFSSLPISLKIYSPAVLKLTLVDLPGLIRVKTDNQSEDSVKEIRNMVLEYISQPNCLILAVSPANQDLALSDALEIAEIVDPERVRTIGVLTKLDLMDEGTDARDILENRKIPLQRGYIGVLNRNQKDIESGKDIHYSLAKEAKFFSSTPCYKPLADRMGTRYLRKTLNEQLYAHIKEYLPTVRTQLSQKLESTRQDLGTLQEKLIHFNMEDTSGLQAFMIHLTQPFIEKFHTVLFGHSTSVSTQELSAGALINFKLYKTILNLPLPTVPSQETLLTIIANLQGVRNGFTMSSLALETVANKLLSLYIDPLNELVNDIAQILESTAKEVSDVLNAYPNFKRELLFLIRNSIADATADTKKSLEKHLKAEMYFVNTCHRDFSFPDVEAHKSLYPIKLWGNKTSKSDYKINSNNATSSSEGESRDSDATEAMESIEANKSAKANGNTLGKIIEKYMNIQQKHIEDTAFKYILYFLVKGVMDFVKRELLDKILVSVDKEIICKDCKEDCNRKRTLESMCKCLEEALHAVQAF